MQRNKMPHKYFLIVLSFLLIISCNKNGVSKNVQKPDGLTNVEELASKEELAPDAVINSDCDYYLDRSDTPSGKLKKGQSVIILDWCYARLDGNDNIDIYIEVETLDKTVKGCVIETYLSYSNTHNNLLLKNILLTESYYYTASAEEVYKEHYLPLINDEEKSMVKDEKGAIIWMKNFLSPKMMLISERHLVFGEGYWVGFDTYRILSIKQENKNTYLLKLLKYPDDEFEIVLLVDDDGITITQIIKKIYLVALSEYDLNIKYISYNKEKSEKIKKDVSAWCSEQLKKF